MTPQAPTCTAVACLATLAGAPQEEVVVEGASAAAAAAASVALEVVGVALDRALPQQRGSTTIA